MPVLPPEANSSSRGSTACITKKEDIVDLVVESYHGLSLPSLPMKHTIALLLIATSYASDLSWESPDV
jgi:hypothetical protein